MKTLISIVMLVTTLSSFAQVSFPSFSNADFDALEAKAEANAVKVAEEFATNSGVELVDVTEGSRSGRYNAVTNTGCKFTVKVGLGFRANVISQTNCQ